MDYSLYSHITKTLEKIIKLPKNINEIEKSLVFLESNPEFIKRVNYNEWFANFIIKNNIHMIARLNNFIREFNITISPYNIYKSMAITEINNEMDKLEKIYGSGVCMKCDMHKNTLYMMDKYPNLFNKKY